MERPDEGATLLARDGSVAAATRRWSDVEEVG